MRRQTKLIIQGFPGSYHDEAAQLYFGSNRTDLVSAESFEIQAKQLAEDQSINYGLMAIENSIAGSILQNYRILRERDFWISGEIFLRISHQLMALPNQELADIHTIESHPMAIYQCQDFLRKLSNVKISESEDTALSAQRIMEEGKVGYAAIASKLAAEKYNLNIIASDIETSKVNYTRFVVISREGEYTSLGNANKASIYLRVPHEKGSLLKVIQSIADHNINISKLQSFPVLGTINTYYFHLDLEFDHVQQYENCIDEIRKVSHGLEELGIYKKANIHDHQYIN